MPEFQSEYVDKPRTRVEQILEKSHFAGNFSEEYEADDPNKDIFMIELDDIKEYVQYLPHLPAGFGFSGGVARGALLEMLGDKAPRPRDLDAEGVSDLGASWNENIESQLKELKVDYYKRSPVISSILSYFCTRDFTVNEVYLVGNKLYFSRRALQDLQRKTIKFTDYEIDNDDTLNPKLLVKALFLQVEFIKLYGQGHIDDLEKWKWDIEGVPAFFLALGLDKAKKKGVPLEFIKRLVELRSVKQEELPDGISHKSVVRLAGLVRHWMMHPREDHRGNNDFRIRGYEFDNDYFNRQYLKEWEIADNQEFDRLLNKARSATKHRNISADDLTW